MASYAYEAIDKAGKTIKGSCEADSPEEVKALIKSQGLILVSTKEQNFLNKDLNIEIGGYPKPRDLSIFCRQFVSMLKAGVTILDCLKMLSDQTENKRLREAIEGVRVSVEKGETLSTSLSLYPKIFPNIMVNMVGAGEASGSLEVALDRMALSFEKTAKTKALVKKALIYPAVVLVVALGIIVVMLVLVIPRYNTMFAELGTELPGITKAVVKLSDALLDYWFFILPIAVALVVGIKMWAGTDAGRRVFHKLKLKLPVISNLEIKQNSSLMARTLTTLLAAGVPLNDAVDITEDTLENVYYKDAMELCKDEITIGQPLSRPLEESGMFPPMVYHMVSIGEESGNQEEMLSRLADYYDEEVEIAVSSLMALLEPMIIIVLALIVGFLVASCLAPMLEMYNSLNSL